MKIVRVTKRLARTIQPKQYHSLTFLAEFTAEVNEKDDLDKVDQDLFDKCSQSIAKDKQRIIEASRKKKEQSNDGNK